MKNTQIEAISGHMGIFTLCTFMHRHTAYPPYTSIHKVTCRRTHTSVHGVLGCWQKGRLCLQPEGSNVRSAWWLLWIFNLIKSIIKNHSNRTFLPLRWGKNQVTSLVDLQQKAKHAVLLCFIRFDMPAPHLNWDITTSVSRAAVRSALLMCSLLLWKGSAAARPEWSYFTSPALNDTLRKAFFTYIHCVIFIHTSHKCVCVCGRGGSRITGAAIKSVERILLVLLHITPEQN